MSHDVMHIEIEGPLSTLLKLILHKCIVELGLFSVGDFNYNLRHFDYGHMSNDKPAEIIRDHLDDNNSLKQSAAQLMTLARTILFVIHLWTSCVDNNLNSIIECFVLCLKIMDISLAYKVTLDDAYTLERLIQIFFLQFKDLCPELLVPKFHFLIHLVRYLLLFGPLRQQSCFRFEGQHAYFTCSRLSASSDLVIRRASP